LVFKKASGERAILLVGQENYVTPDAGLFGEVERLCGASSVMVNRMGRRPGPA
jgi:hypothetical protein